MWEPHQLSALPAALVLALYTAIAGTTTGALLFVRAVVLVCKAAMSAVFYRDFKQTIGRHGALLSAVVLFVYTPKWFLGPDYISQQFHFTVAAFLCFYHYYTHGFRRPWLVVLGAVCACFSFLAFPQSALAAAVIFIGMVLLGRRGKEPTICKIPRGAVLFVLGCMACAAAFLAYVLPGMGLTVFLQRVSLILNDPQYDFDHKPAAGPVGKPGTEHRQIPGKAAGRQRGALSAVVGQTRQKRDWIGLALNLWAILAALLCAVRAVADSSSDERYFMPALVLAAAWAFRRARHGVGAAVLAGLSAGHGGVCVHSALYAAGLFAGYLLMYLTWPALCGCFAMSACRQENPEQGKLPQGQCVLAALLVFLLVCRFWCVLVTGWKPANVATANLKQITAGPAAGTWADEKAADMQMALYEALEPFAGKQVLQAIGEQHGLGFMMAGGTLTIGQASVISGTDSDPRFIQYYEELPEKRPDVILYDEAEVRDMAAFHAWIEENFTITARYPVTHGTAHLQVLVVD